MDNIFPGGSVTPTVSEPSGPVEPFAPDDKSITAYAPKPQLGSFEPQASPFIVPYAKADKPIQWDDTVLSNRVNKYHFGLGEESPGIPQLYGETKAGREDTVRTQRSLEQDAKDLRTRDESLQNLARTRKPGSPLSQAEKIEINRLKPEDFEEIRNDPKTFYEKKFAGRVLDTAWDMYRANFWSKQREPEQVPLADPGGVPGAQFFRPMRTAAENIITRQQALIKILEEREAKWKELPFLAKGLSVTEGFIPLLNAGQLQSALSDVTTSILPGNKIADGLDYIWNIPIKDVVPQANRLLDALEQRNPELAISFARALVQYSTMDRYLNNSQLFADVGITTGIVTKVVSKVVPPAVTIGSAMKDIIKATSSRKFTAADLAEATGNYDIAGQLKGLEFIRARAASSNAFNDIKDALPSGWDVNAVVNGDGSKMADERARRIANLIIGDRARLEEAVGATQHNPIVINRLDPGSEAEKAATAKTDEIFNIQFPNAVDHILNIRTVRQEESLGALYQEYQLGRVPPTPQPEGKYVLAPVKRAGTPLDKVTNAFEAPLRAANENREISPLVDTLKRLEEDLKTATGKDREEIIDLMTLLQEGGPDRMEIQFGTKAAVLFDDPAAAELAAKDLGLHGYRIKQRGDGYYISYMKAVDINDTDVFNALRIDTTINKTPASLTQRVLGAVGSQGKRVTKQLETDMVLADYGPGGLLKLIQAYTAPVAALSRKELKELNEFMAFQQSQIHPDTGHVGRFSEDIFELDKDWMTKNGKLPSEAQSRAYFNLTGLSDADYVVRDIGVTKDKAFNGAELHSFPVNTTVDDKLSKLTPEPNVEGKVLLNMDDVFKNPEDAGVLVWNPDIESMRIPFPKFGNGGYFRKNFASGGWKLKEREDYIKDLLKNKGYRIVQLSHYGEEELRQLEHLKDAKGKFLLEERPINYIITKDLESAPLGLNNFPRRPGIHKEYPVGNHYTSQPRIRIAGSGKNETAYYYGDNHMFTHPVEKEAIRMTELANQARIMMVNNDPNLPAFYAKNLPGTLEHFIAKFRGKNAIFDEKIPLFTKSSGLNVGMEKQLQNYYRDQGIPNFKRAMDSTHNLYANTVNMKFLAERGQTIRQFSRTGDMETPGYHYRPTQLIEPVVSANRGFSSLIRDQWLGDLKHKMMNAYLAEFGDLLDTSSIGGLEALRRNPVAAISTPYRPVRGAEIERKWAAQNFRRTMINFLNLRNDADSGVKSWKQALINRINDAFPNSKMDFIEPWLLHKEKSGLNLARNVAFHATQGLLNPASLILHASVMTQAIALEGYKRALPAMIKSFFMAAAEYSTNPKVHEELARYATKGGGNPDHWLEALRGWQRSGMGQIGGEHMLKSTYWEEPAIRGKFGAVADLSTWFFNTGVRLNRRAAWVMAYDRVRDEIGARAFTNADWQAVQHRAQILSGSMSRAHAAAWQQGWLGIPTQFLQYPARITETLWGRDFTNQERLAWFARYSAMYGLPSAPGVAVPLWPYHKWINSTLEANGIDVDDNMVLRAIDQGFFGVMFSMLAGQRMTVEERFGQQGGLQTTIEDIRTGKKGLLETLGGPSGIFEPVTYKSTGSLLWDSLGAGGSLFGAATGFAKDLLTGKPMFNKAVQVQQLVDTVRSFTGGNHLMQLYYAAQLHAYISKNQEVLLGDYSQRAAWIAFLTGLRPYKIDQMYNVLADQQLRYDAQRKAMNKASSLFRVMLRTESIEDQQALQSEMQTYIEMAGLNSHEKMQFLKRMSRGYEDKYLQIMSHWAIEKPETTEYVQKQLRK